MANDEHIRANSSTEIPIYAEPVPEAVLDFIRRNLTPDKVEDDLLAYREFCDRYIRQKNAKLRIVMQQVLNWTLSEDSSITNLRYALGDMLNSALKAERKAQKTSYPDEIYRVVGDPIGRALHWKELNIKPRTPSNRLPLQPRLQHRPYSNWTADEIAGAYIEVATHRLSIGGAVNGIMKSLEDRYGLDFKKLEKDFQRRHKRRSD